MTDTAAWGAPARHPSVARVLQTATERGLRIEIRQFPEGTRTAEDAARAVGCSVGQIVKSLVFVADPGPRLGGRPGRPRSDRRGPRSRRIRHPATDDPARHRGRGAGGDRLLDRWDPAPRARAPDSGAGGRGPAAQRGGMGRRRPSGRRLLGPSRRAGARFGSSGRGGRGQGRSVWIVIRVPSLMSSATSCQIWPAGSRKRMRAARSDG